MIVTAVLAWFDEPVELLEECVRSLATVADRLVAVDGGYELAPDARRSSPPEQAKAIVRTGRAVGLDVEGHTPRHVWPGQVAKRDWMVKRALAGRPDWLMLVDADWVARGKREKIRFRLLTTTADALEVPFWTPPPLEPDAVDRLAPHQWHADTADQTIYPRVFLRALPGLRVERHHWWYSGLRAGRRVGLWGCEDLYPPATAALVADSFMIEHRCFFRETIQLERNRAYCAARDAQVVATGAEA